MTRIPVPSIGLMAIAWLFLLPTGTAAQATLRAGPERLGPLHDRAVTAGGQVVEALNGEGDVFLVTLQEMSAHADAVVVARVLTKTCHLDPSGGQVQSDVALKVLQVVKGGVEADAEIMVRVPGGEYQFGDGTRVSQSMPGYTPMRLARMYVLFLRKAPGATADSQAGFRLAGGASSQFEMDSRAAAMVPSSTRARDGMNTRYRDMGVDVFFRELYASVRSSR